MRLLKHPLMVFLTAFVILAVATQCGPTPTPQIIKETVVVTKEVEKEVEIVVTATPEPKKAEALPQAPDKMGRVISLEETLAALECEA